MRGGSGTVCPRRPGPAREVEPRLPHVGGVLAVSDWTFAQLARVNLDTPVKGALASIHLDRLAATPDAREQRRLAKGEYHLNRPAIESEQRRQTAAAAAGYRAGKIWTPTGPTWNVTVVKMTEAIVPRSAAIASRELKRDRPPAR